MEWTLKKRPFVSFEFQRGEKSRSPYAEKSTVYMSTKFWSVPVVPRQPHAHIELKEISFIDISANESETTCLYYVCYSK